MEAKKALVDALGRDAVGRRYARPWRFADHRVLDGVASLGLSPAPRVIDAVTVIPATVANIVVNDPSALMTPHRLSPFGTLVYHALIIFEKINFVNPNN